MIVIPLNIDRFTGADLMVDQRRRPWPIIEPTPGGRVAMTEWDARLCHTLHGVKSNIGDRCTTLNHVWY